MTRLSGVPGFEFTAPGRIVFGPGAASLAGREARDIGETALVVTGRDPARSAPVLRALAERAVATVNFPVAREPDVDTVRAAAALARRERCSLIVAIGGGSVLDAGKAAAAMAVNPGDILDYLETAGRGRVLEAVPLPWIAVPTTAGTGAEATRNAVVTVPGRGLKVSLRSPALLPRVALVDPTLTLSLPPAVTAATGLDALTQLFEAFVSTRANPLTDALCREGLTRAARSLRQAWARGDDLAARADMSLAALLSGLALAAAGLGAVHGLAAALGGTCPSAAHGSVCARLLPVVSAANVRALRARSASGEALDRYNEVGRLLTGRPWAVADDAVLWVEDVVRSMGLPPLSAAGLSPDVVSVVAARAAAADSTRTNPVALGEDELREILTAVLPPAGSA